MKGLYVIRAYLQMDSRVLDSYYFMVMSVNLTD